MPGWLVDLLDLHCQDFGRAHLLVEELGDAFELLWDEVGDEDHADAA